MTGGQLGTAKAAKSGLSNEQQTNATLKVVGFLPWLWLSKEVTIGGFSFVPFFDGSGHVTSSLSGLKDAQNSDDPWRLSEASIDRVQWACSLLFLASWSARQRA
jgi:hypothetical protein